MSRVRMILTLILFLSFARFAICNDDIKPLGLSDVIKLATDTVNDKDVSVQNARLELEMLEALGRTRVDLRPQFSLWSFSNPVLLAISLGTSISVNRRTAPSPLNLELARFAVVEAELGRTRARLTSRIETTRLFFSLAESQVLAERTCDIWNARTRDHDQIQTLVSLNRITKLDVVRYEQDITALESDCVEATAQAQLAATALGRLIGVSDSSKLRVSTSDLSEISAADMPSSNDLIDTALESQGDFSVIRHHVSQLASTGTKRSLHFDYLSAGYSYLKNEEKASSAVGPQYLLGGNVGHVDTGFYIPLRNTGDERATASFLQARFNRLQKDVQDLKRTIRYEVEDNIQRAALAAARLRLSQRKLQLATELHSLTTERRQVGLQPSSDELWAARDADRAQTETLRAELEWKRTAYTVLTLSYPERLRSLTAAARTADSSPVKSVQCRTTLTGAFECPANTAGLRTGSAQVAPTPVSYIAPAAPLHLSPAAAMSTARQYSPAAQPQSPVQPIYRPPHPLNRVIPNFQASGAINIAHPVQIDVNVSIDETGRVTDARISNEPADSNRILAKQAVAAAKLWTFEPAKVHGQNVPCKHIISFVFERRS